MHKENTSLTVNRGMGDQDRFSLTGTDSSFKSRSKDLFAALDAAAKKQEAKQKVTVSKRTDRLFIKQDPKPQDFQTLSRGRVKLPADFEEDPGFTSVCTKPTDQKPSGKPSFKTPGRAPLKRKMTPDYVANPDKWTRYDLSDVPDEHMSNTANTAAALSFLTELRARKARESGEAEPEADLDAKPMFRKPSSITTATRTSSETDDIEEHTSSTEDKSTFRGNVLVMPEYVIGASKKKDKKKKKIETNKDIAAGGKVQLGHLDDPDDEDEDG